jgi:peptidoglycan/LPS O-acetylase OafA/YrhL
VYFLTTSTAGLKLTWDVGSRGVDVFFVISGFIIAYIGTGRPNHFFRRRLIRVVPFYWAATLVVFAVALLAPHLFRTTSANVPHLVYSLGFVPHENRATGEMMPTLVLGWSLNFEMFFYVLFALGLLVSPRRAPLVCVACILGFVLLVHTIGTSNGVVAFFARPIVVEFCYGVLAFYIFRWCSEHASALANIKGLRILLTLAFAGGLVLLNVLEHAYRDQVPRYLIAGIPAFVIVLSALLLERIYRVATSNKVVYLLGEASYIIYLVHPYIVFAVLRLVVKDATLATPVLIALILFLLTLTSVISVAIHLYFEKPLMAYLRARLT